jgi:hypothetical protein
LYFIITSETFSSKKKLTPHTLNLTFELGMLHLISLLDFQEVERIVIYGISGLFKILPTRGICNLRGLARVGYYLEWVVLNNPRMPYNVLSNIPKFLDNDIIDEILLPMGYGR